MSKSLVIVESPAKAKTIAAYLGGDYMVESSIGHIRDLPRKVSELPERLRGTSAANSETLGVEVDNAFRAFYVVDADKKQQITKLKQLLKQADSLFLATDEDREGESIAWHLLEVLKPRVPVKRMVFHEITKSAIQRAIQEPRELDRRLVNAQEARRILDRLYGYGLSPVLWRKVAGRLSAGRVQSVATRIIVERERARMRFRKARYWDIAGTFLRAADRPAEHGAECGATLVQVGGKRLASGKDFGEDGRVKRDDVVVLSEESAQELVAALPRYRFRVSSVERKPFTRRPSAPFMTSTLQQEASRKLRFAAQRTMRAAQSLYENGYITYMRTDSTTLSSAAQKAARQQIGEMYGRDYLPSAPRIYSKKVKNAQEAHEAIRPAGDRFRTPDQVKSALGTDQARLYELIWKRTVASQMNDARGETLIVRIEGTSGAGGPPVEFSVSGRTILFPGFLRAYVEGKDDPEAELEDKERHLPPLREGDVLSPKAFEPQGHETQPPARFTEASLVRALEELGVGRPSTYAAILGTILDRGYVWKKGSALVPSFTAFAVISLLEKHFPTLVDYTFTARMEDGLDLIASGEEDLVPWLERFYFGPNAPPANDNEPQRTDGRGHKMAVAREPAIHMAREPTISTHGREPTMSTQGREPSMSTQGREPTMSTQGREPSMSTQGREPSMSTQGREPSMSTQGREPSMSTQGREPTMSIGLRDMVGNLGDIDARAINSLPLGKDPDGVDIVVRVGKYGAFLERGEDRNGLPEQCPPDELTVERALELLARKDRELGPHPETGETIYVRDGRFGPFVQLGEASEDRTVKPKTASLFKTMSVESVTLAEALQLLSLPREIGIDEDGEPIKALNGRYGPYIQKGKDSRSLESEELLFTYSLDQAKALLAQPKRRGQRRAAEPLRTFDADPVSGKPLVVKDGRFGPYVTDGETNATIPRGETIAELTFERAVELVQARREKGPSKRGAKKKTAKKKTAKASPKKKASAAKKSPVKKAATAKKKSASAKGKRGASKKADDKSSNAESARARGAKRAEAADDLSSTA